MKISQSLSVFKLNEGGELSINYDQGHLYTTIDLKLSEHGIRDLEILVEDLNQAVEIAKDIIHSATDLVPFAVDPVSITKALLTGTLCVGENGVATSCEDNLECLGCRGTGDCPECNGSCDSILSCICKGTGLCVECAGTGKRVIHSISPTTSVPNSIEEHSDHRSSSIQICERCNGSGYGPSLTRVCENCNGWGTL